MRTAEEKKAYNKSWNLENRDYVNAVRKGEKAAVHNVAARFRVTPELARCLVEKRARGYCVLCRMLGLHRAGRFVIDHNHITGAVRDVLCDFHNVMVGYIEKTSELEKRLVHAYLMVAETGLLHVDPYNLPVPH